MQFFEESIDPRYYGHVVLLAPGEMLKIEEDIPMERILKLARQGEEDLVEMQSGLLKQWLRKMI